MSRKEVIKNKKEKQNYVFKAIMAFLITIFFIFLGIIVIGLVIKFGPGVGS